MLPSFIQFVWDNTNFKYFKGSYNGRIVVVGVKTFQSANDCGRIGLKELANGESFDPSGYTFHRNDYLAPGITSWWDRPDPAFAREQQRRQHEEQQSDPEPVPQPEREHGQRDETTEALTDASQRCAKLTDDAEPLFRVVFSRLQAAHELLKTAKGTDTPETDSATAAFDATLKAFLKELEGYTTASVENGNYTYKKLFVDHVIEHKKVIAALNTICGGQTGNNSARDGVDIVFTRLENDATTDWETAFEDEQAKWINRLTARVHDEATITPYKEDALLALEAVTRLHDAKQGRDAAEWQNNELARTLWDKLQAMNDYAGLPLWFVPESFIKLGRRLGAGSFGEVYYGTRWGTPVVIKRLIKHHNCRLDKELRAKFIDEAKHWYGLQDRHILRMYGACHLAVPPFFVCEEARAGDLRQVLARDKSKMWRLLHDSARGIGYLHSRNIVHGDLKLDNIIVGDDGYARVADFGLSRVKDRNRINHLTLNDSSLGSGALRWRAPEALNHKAQIPSDVYSFAMCIVEAVSGELPYASLTTESEVIAKIRATDLPEKPEHMPDKIWELIQNMTVINPSERATITEVIVALKDQADIEFNAEFERRGPDTQNHDVDTSAISSVPQSNATDLHSTSLAKTQSDFRADDDADYENRMDEFVARKILRWIRLVGSGQRGSGPDQVLR